VRIRLKKNRLCYRPYEDAVTAFMRTFGKRSLVRKTYEGMTFRHQLHERIRWALPLSLIVGVIFVFLELAGYQGRWKAWSDPRPLEEVWWHSLVVAACLLAFFLLCPDPNKEKE
jgi:hypothetical protein